jgi:hypothetical protein
MTLRAPPNPLGKCLAFNKFGSPFDRVFDIKHCTHSRLNDCFFSGTPRALVSI